MMGSHTGLLLSCLLLSSYRALAQYPVEAGGCFDQSSATLFSWEVQDAVERKSFTDGDADVVFNRFRDYFVLDPNSEIPVKLRQGGKYPIDIIAPDDEPFTKALLRIEGQGTLEPKANAQEVSCGPGATGLISQDGEHTELGGEYTIADDAEGDIVVDATLIYEDDEGETRYAHQRYTMLGVLEDTEAPGAAATKEPTATPTSPPTMRPTAAPTTSPTATNREVVVLPGTPATGSGAPPTIAPTVSPTTIQERVSSQVGTPGATDRETPSDCSICADTMILGDLEQVVRVDRLPFNCRDLEERSELFDPAFCAENIDTILNVCGGCVPAPIPVSPPTPMPTLGPINEQAPTSAAMARWLVTLVGAMGISTVMLL